MFKHMLLGLGAASLLAVVTAMPAQAASLLGQAPHQLVIVNAGGLEWVWASPCAGEQPSCDGKGDLGDVLHHGFGFASPEQWNASFASLSALDSAFNPAGGQLCAATYFSQDWDHCNTGDLRGGFVWHSPLAPTGTERNNGSSETFLVRVSDPVIVPIVLIPTPPKSNSDSTAVPEPSSLFLLGAGLLGLAAWRWKQTA
jgi:hypothetical protein